MFYSGIDKHKDNCFIVTINEQGAVVKDARVTNSVAPLTAYFRSLPANEAHRAVVEATMSWYWLDDLLTSLGIDLVLAHPKYLKAIAYAKVKTDKVDARILANLLRLGYVPEAHKVSRALRETRDLTRARLRLVYRRTSCYNSIHRLREKYNCDHVIEVEGTGVPAELPALVREQIDCQRAQIQLLSGQIDRLERLVNDRLVENEGLNPIAWSIADVSFVSIFADREARRIAP
jgi:transposase